MPKRFCDEDKTGDWPMISLEGGLDESPYDPDTLEIREQGMCFESQWQFSIGTQLHVTAEAGVIGAKRVGIDGIVVDSSQKAARRFSTTVLFLERTELSSPPRPQPRSC